MNLLFMANNGLPRNGLVAFYDPYRDTYGRNIANANIGTTSGMTVSTTHVRETTGNVPHVASFSDNLIIGNKYYASYTFKPIGRKRFIVTAGTSNIYILVDIETVSIITAVGTVINPSIIANDDGSYTVKIGSLNDTINKAFIYSALDNATTIDDRIFVGDTSCGFDMVSWQINLGTLYPYSPPAGLPQSLTDYTGHANNAQLGSTAGSDTNDPAYSGQGLTFGTDDYAKSSSPAFDDMQAFTCITVCKTLSSGGGSSGRLFYKANREYRFELNNLTYRQGRVTGIDAWKMNSGLTFGANVITGMAYDTNNLETSPKMWNNNIKSVVTRTGIGAGIALSDASTDLYICNVNSADRYFDGTIFLMAWYNRILSDTEYMQAYNYLKRLMSSRGITI